MNPRSIEYFKMIRKKKVFLHFHALHLTEPVKFKDGLHVAECPGPSECIWCSNEAWYVDSYRKLKEGIERTKEWYKGVSSEGLKGGSDIYKKEDKEGSNDY